jgi:uncharacterized membrane protein HdeD (DUF308 family)
MNLKQNSLAAVAFIVIGAIMLLPEIGIGILYYGIYAVGMALVVLGLIDLLQKNWVMGIVKMVVGLALFLLAYFVPEIFVYLIAAVLILFGAYMVYNAIKSKPKGALNWIVALAMPILSIVAGILLFIQAEIVFTIMAIILIVDGLLIILNDYVLNK